MEQVEAQSLSHRQFLDSHRQQECFRIQTFKLYQELRQQSLYSCQDIMSDYEYEEEEYQYEQQPNEEDVETKVELEYFQIEALIREGKWEQSIDELQRLYTTAEQNNLKNYKVKILNQLLQIYSKNSRKANLKSTLQRISQLNNQEKYTETAIKSIIAILRANDYVNIRQDLLNLIASLDPLLKIKSYLMLLEKSVDEKDIKDSQSIFAFIYKIGLEGLPANILLEIYSLQIKLSKLTKTDISDKIREIELRIPTLESQAYMSQGHISILKLTIAENMYRNQNYENAALYIGQAFFEKAKYGNSAQLKEILKTNVLISLLIENSQLKKDGRYNLLLHDSSHPFKNDKEIHELIALADAYDKHDLDQFSRNYENVRFRPQNQDYLSVQSKLLWNMKKSKLVIILRAYQTISFQHIGRRLQMKSDEVELMAFKLIVDEKIRGRICNSQKNGKYLLILPERNEFLQIQAENLKQLSKRYLLA